MDHALGMRERDRLGHRDHLRQQREPVGARRRAREYLVERLSRHVLHRVERPAVAASPHPVHRHDRGMLEPCGDATLALEAAPQILAICADELQRDRASQSFTARDQHDAHPARTELALDDVALGRVLEQRSGVEANRHSLRCARRNECGG